MKEYSALLVKVKSSLPADKHEWWDHVYNFIKYEDSEFCKPFIEEDKSLVLVVNDDRTYPELLTEENIVATNLHEKILIELGF